MVHSPLAGIRFECLCAKYNITGIASTMTTQNPPPLHRAMCTAEVATQTSAGRTPKKPKKGPKSAPRGAFRGAWASQGAKVHCPPRVLRQVFPPSASPPNGARGGSAPTFFDPTPALRFLSAASKGLFPAILGEFGSRRTEEEEAKEKEEEEEEEQQNKNKQNQKKGIKKKKSHMKKKEK